MAVILIIIIRGGQIVQCSLDKDSSTRGDLTHTQVLHPQWNFPAPLEFDSSLFAS